MCRYIWDFNGIVIGIINYIGVIQLDLIVLHLD